MKRVKGTSTPSRTPPSIWICFCTSWSPPYHLITDSSSTARAAGLTLVAACASITPFVEHGDGGRALLGSRINGGGLLVFARSGK